MVFFFFDFDRERCVWEVTLFETVIKQPFFIALILFQPTKIKAIRKKVVLFKKFSFLRITSETAKKSK